MSDDTGPSFESLMKLRDALPSLAHGLSQKKFGGKGRPVVRPRPRKTCPVCCLLFDLITDGKEEPLVVENCKDCDEKLKEGWTALCGGDKYAFIRNKTLLADLAGQIVHVSPGFMENVARQFRLEMKARENHNGKSTPPQDAA